MFHWVNGVHVHILKYILKAYNLSLYLANTQKMQQEKQCAARRNGRYIEMNILVQFRCILFTADIYLYG